MTTTKQPMPLPPLAKEAAADAPQRQPAGAKRHCTLFRQHSDFVTHWHRVIKSHNGISVWHYLWSIAHRDGRWMFVGAERIADRTGVHERTAKRWLKRLEGLGLLEVQRPVRFGRGSACGYRIPAVLPLPQGRVADAPPFEGGKGGG